MYSSLCIVNNSSLLPLAVRNPSSQKERGNRSQRGESEAEELQSCISEPAKPGTSARASPPDMSLQNWIKVMS